MQDGQPIIGDDFHGFLDNAFAIELEDRRAEIRKRFEANQYHLKPGISQEETDQAYRTDAARLALIDEMLGQVVEAPETEQLPPHLREKAADLDRREKALDEKQHGEKVGERQKFEATMQTDASTRLMDGIGKIMASVEKQGGAVSPYLENIFQKL